MLVFIGTIFTTDAMPSSNMLMRDESEYHAEWRAYSRYTGNEYFCVPILPNSRLMVWEWGWYRHNSVVISLKKGDSNLQTKFSVNSIEFKEPKALISVFVYKSESDAKLNRKYRLMAYDHRGNIVCDILQVNSPYKTLAGFCLDAPLSEVVKLVVLDDHRDPINLRPEIYLAVKI